MCAFEAQVINEERVAASHVNLSVHDSVTSTGCLNRALIGAIRDVSDITVGKELLEIMGADAAGVDQVAAIFEIVHGNAKVTVQVNQMYDVSGAKNIVAGGADGVVQLSGHQTDVKLTQVYQLDDTKGWELTFAKAYVNFLTLKPNKGEESIQTIEITPYNDSGTPVYVFTPQATV